MTTPNPQENTSPTSTDSLGELRDAEQFVKVYMSAIKGGYDSAWVGQRLGLSAKRVATRASKYRKMGIQLPYMPTHRKPVDIDSINEYIESFSNGQ